MKESWILYPREREGEVRIKPDKNLDKETSSGRYETTLFFYLYPFSRTEREGMQQQTRKRASKETKQNNRRAAEDEVDDEEKKRTRISSRIRLTLGFLFSDGCVFVPFSGRESISLPLFFRLFYSFVSIITTLPVVCDESCTQQKNREEISCQSDLNHTHFSVTQETRLQITSADSFIVFQTAKLGKGSSCFSL